MNGKSDSVKAFLEEHNIKLVPRISYKNIMLAFVNDEPFLDCLKNIKVEDDIYNTSVNNMTRILEIEKILKTLDKKETVVKNDLDVFPIAFYNTILKQIPKQLKYLKQNMKILNDKKISTVCMQHARRAFSRTSKTNPFLKAKRITKELNNYYKKKERIKREPSVKKIASQKKKEFEEKEALRQKKKLNYLINQSELFSHFMMNKTKIDNDIINEENEIAIRAAESHIRKLNEFDEKKLKKNKEAKASCNMDVNESKMIDKVEKNVNEEVYIDQPKIIIAKLKGYQIQGLTWLVNLYNQGINGILADDMGLGKTVQTLSFMAYLFETEGITGPFLVITPASTLHNWIAEFEKFLPSFKTCSYWGNVNERKNLRKQFNNVNVVVTSYQMIVTDEKIFKRINWHYMILDEAQAIKSSASLRWKTLLTIGCRNRLLLTGTPIQNTMGELWALLHFIMPTLFDSHDEFSTWFSKDIEKEGKRIDDIQLNRLHMILKPFMLRREKNDVKDELGTKTEKDVYCEMSARQRRLYRIIQKQKNVSIDDLTCAIQKNAFMPENKSKKDKTIGDDALLNMAMQLRKVCNHPDLFEREEVTSGYCFEVNDYYQASDNIELMHRSKLSINVPRMIGDFIIDKEINSNNKIIEEISQNTHMNRVDFIKRKFSSIDNIGFFQNDENFIAKKFKTDIDKNSSFLHEYENIYTPLVLTTRPRINTTSFLMEQSLVNYNSEQALENISQVNISVPRLDTFISDSGKLVVLDALLHNLKKGGHRVLIYFQMTRMMNLMEDYLVKKGYTYCRLDGSCRLNVRRDVVNNWQTSDEKFVFILSTRAGGLGINLTAADRVIFYDSDWNPTMDQQAMDRAHRLGQTKDVIVYRLITKDTIEERVIERAARKDEIQKIVIQGGEFGFKEMKT